MIHYGILGMKWGVRRYQNKDGSLTKAGQKRYGNMSDEKLRRTFQKEITVRQLKQKKSGAIGEHSKKAVGKYTKALKAQNKRLTNNEEYQKHLDEYYKWQTAWLNRKIDDDTFFKKEAEYTDRESKVFANLFDERLDSHRVYASKEEGWKYTEAYINSFGKDITLGYLRDLGFNEETAKQFEERLTASRKSFY